MIPYVSGSGYGYCAPSTRPDNWFPLSGGDPCPGNPNSWDPLIAHWGTQAKTFQDLDNNLAQIDLGEAESERIKKLEQIKQDARANLQDLVQKMTAAEVTISHWKDDLTDMQTRADQTLQAAQAFWESIKYAFKSSAHTAAQDLAKAGFVPDQYQPYIIGAGVALTESPFFDLILNAFPDQMLAIRTAQETIDGIRDEYRNKMQIAVSEYQLTDVQQLASLGRLPSTNPFTRFVATAGKILEDVTGIDATTVKTVADKASKAAESPDAYRAYLDALEDLSPQELAAFFTLHKELAFYPLTGTGDTVWDAATVKAWWAGLSEDQQQTLIQAAPGLIGNLNGVPYSVRDRANRVLVDKLLSDRNPAGLDEASLEAVRKTKEAADMGTEAAPVSIVLLDISNSRDDDGIDENNVLAATAVGDVDAADVVSVAIPGMNNNVTDSMEDMTKHATTMYNHQAEKLAGTGKRTATIAYVGYETPTQDETTRSVLERRARKAVIPPVGPEVDDSRSVFSNELAIRGGYQLGAFVDGVNVTKSTNTEVPEHGAGVTDAYNDPFVSLQAHSYGTTTTAQALTHAQTAVDNAVFYGSAGLTEESVEAANKGDWRLEKNEHGQQQLYSTRPDMDWLAPFGQYGSHRKSPDDIDFVQGFGESALVDAQGNYWHDVDHHPVDSSDTPSFTDPGMGKQQGYWASDAAPMLEGQEAALTGIAPDREGVYLRAYLYEKDPMTGNRVKITVTEEKLNNARANGTYDLLLKQMADSQGINLDDVVSDGPVPIDSTPDQGDQE